MSAAPPPREYDQILSGDIKIKKVKSHESTHKITFSKKNISKVLMYQVWSDTSVDLNNDRIVKEVKATSWVKSAFRKVEMVTVPSNSNCICTKEYNPVICPNGKKYSNGCEAGCANQQNCKPFSDIPFTPTTVMELDDGECPYHHKAKNCNEKDECRHVFVIKRALVNKCGQVVFYVSSEDIVLPSNPNQEVKRLKTIPTGSFCRARFDIDAFSNTPPAPSFNDCGADDTGIQDQSVFFEYITNSSSTITFKATPYLNGLAKSSGGLSMTVYILPENTYINDIYYVWQCVIGGDDPAFICNDEDDRDFFPHVNTTLNTKARVLVKSTYFEDNLVLYIGDISRGFLLSSSSKGFIVFRRQSTNECAGKNNRCYITFS
jgi:hypothetical protein